MTPAPDGLSTAVLARLARRGKLALLAGAVAIAGVAAPGAPARAQTTDELLALLLGATAVATIVRSFDSDTRSRQRLGAGVLPDSCLERVRLHRRNIDLYHASCLEWYGIDRLPRRCASTIRTNVGPRRYFLAQCLYDANYRAQRGWSGGHTYWEAPGFGVRPHDPPRGAPHRPRDGRGWRDGRDRRDDRGWRDGRDRSERGWRGGRDRDERERSGGDRRDRDRGRDDDRRRAQPDRSPVAPEWDPGRDGDSDRWMHRGP